MVVIQWYLMEHKCISAYAGVLDIYLVEGYLGIHGPRKKWYNVYPKVGDTKNI